MFVIVLLRHFLARIRIAILAQMWAGIVLADVLAHHAAAELPLAFVVIVAVLDDGRFGIEEVAFGNLHAKETSAIMLLSRCICICNLNLLFFSNPLAT